jgi:hypothetical protein
MAGCYFLCLDAKKVTKEKSSPSDWRQPGGADAKRLKFTCESYSEKAKHEK